MIVDIGGGTIDGCTYRIVRTQPLRLEEAAVGEGPLPFALNARARH